MTTALTSGKLIIAEPFLGDPNFERSVVLLCEHNDNGSFGLILNQTTENSLSDVIDGIYYDYPLFIGGPVEHNTLHYIHRLGDVIDDSVMLSEDLYWSGNFETIKNLINIGSVKPEDIRFFLGYSGWGEGQLAAEFAKSSWFISDTSAELIFENNPKQFWRTVLKLMGGDFKVLSNYPTDPRLN